MIRPIVVVGAGGHAKVLIDTLLAREVAIMGLVDSDPSRKGSSVLGMTVLGNDEWLMASDPESVQLVNGLGSVGSTRLRQEVYDRYLRLGFKFVSVVHPSAILGREVALGPGVQVMAGAILQSGTVLGANVIVNTGAVVDHDCIIGDHVHLAPRAVLSGGVKIGARTHIGTGATVIQGVSVGDDCIVGAGAVVVRNVISKQTVVGVPARAR